MRKDEAIIKIINKLDIMYGDIINQQDVRMALEEVLYDYEVTEKTTALVPMNNMQDKMQLYLISKKIDGLLPASIELYGRYLKKFSETFVMNVEDVTTMDIRKFLAMYMQKGVSNNTIVTITDILRGFFTFLHNEEYIMKNPMDKINTMKREESKRKPLTHEQIEILYGGCKTLREKSILSMFLATGVRLSELANLDKSDIDWESQKVFIRDGKGNKDRTVYFNAKAKVFLRQYLKSRNDTNNALFVTSKKPINRISVRSIQDEIKRIRNRSGLDINVHPHLLRYSTATNGHRNGMNILTIQKILGHSNISTTQIYTKTSDIDVEYEYRKHMNG